MVAEITDLDEVLQGKLYRVSKSEKHALRQTDTKL